MGGDEIALFIVVMMLITAFSGITLSWMRGRQRMAEIRAEASGRALIADDGMAALTSENAGLRTEVTRLHERIATLERIVTDPAERTAREIESLR
jgi:hypothetical protein